MSLEALKFLHENNTDQPGNPRCLISAFGIYSLESMKTKQVTRKYSVAWLVSVAE